MIGTPINVRKEMININIIGTKEIGEMPISILNITINIDNKHIHLGEFYVDYIEEIDDEFYSYIYNLLIEHADSIIFENNRYIGTNDDIISLFGNDFENENLTEMYSEFMEMDKDTKEYKKYSRFFELYFHSHKISDTIRKIYLDKNNFSILEFENLDYEIKKEFSNPMNELVEEMEQEEMLERLDSIKETNEYLKKELELIEEIIEKIENIIKVKEKNYDIRVSAKKLEAKLSSMSIFDRRKKEIKSSLNALNSSIIKVDIEKEKEEIRQLFSNYATLYKDSKGLGILFDNMPLGDIIYILKDLYKKKLSNYNQLKKEEIELEEKTNGYIDNTIDISDLYERVEMVKTKE